MELHQTDTSSATALRAPAQPHTYVMCSYVTAQNAWFLLFCAVFCCQKQGIAERCTSVADDSRAMACPMPLPQLLPCAASAWLIAVAVDTAVPGLVSCCCSCCGLFTSTAGGALAGPGAGAGAGLAAGTGVGTDSAVAISLGEPAAVVPGGREAVLTGPGAGLVAVGGLASPAAVPVGSGLGGVTRIAVGGLETGVGAGLQSHAGSSRYQSLQVHSSHIDRYSVLCAHNATTAVASAAHYLRAALS
jgi:hypothetical protein